MPISRTPIIDDDGTGETGTAIDNAWKQQFYDQIDAQIDPIGKWSMLSTAPGVFQTPAGSGATWTVTAAIYGGTHLGEYPNHTAALSLFVSNSMLTGGPTSLNIALPSLTASRTGVGTAYVLHGGTWEICAAIAFPNSPLWALQRAGFAPFAAGAVQVYASIIVPLTPL